MEELLSPERVRGRERERAMWRRVNGVLDDGRWTDQRGKERKEKERKREDGNLFIGPNVIYC